MNRKLCLILAFVIALCVCISANAETNAEQYENAIGLLKENKYAEAGTVFAALGSYKDSPRYVMYCNSIVAGEAGNYTIAVSNLTNLGDFLDSQLLATYYAGLSWESTENYEKALEVLAGITLYRDISERIATYPEKIQGRDYRKADEDEKAGRLESALSGFKGLGNYKDSKVRAAAVQEKINERDYAKADKAEQQDKLEDALSGFMALGSYKDSADRVKAVREKIKERDETAAEKAREDAYAAADKAEQDGDYATAYSGFAALCDYKDSIDRAAAVQDKGNYAKAMQYAMSGNYSKAYELFKALGDYEDAAEKAYVTGVSSFATKINDLGKGTASFLFHDVWGIIDVSTNTTISPNWDSIGSFNSFDLARVKKNELYGYINRQGIEVVPCKYYSVSDFDENGLCIVAGLRKEKTNFSTIPYYDMGIYDKNGTVIIDPKYRTWQRIGNSFNSNWGSSYNNVSVETPSFSDGKIKAQNADGKWGFINLEGKLVGQVRWDKIGGFSEGMAAVLENGMYGYIASNGVVLIEPQYMAADVFSEGQAWVKTSDGLWQCIDKSNQVIIEAKYSSVTKFKNGLADVLLPDVGWQIIDAQGNMVYFKTNEIILSYDETNTPAPSYTEGDIELAQEVTDIPKTTEAPVMPVGQIINRYGITNKNANFRKGPSTGDGKYGELLAGTYVYLIYTETGTDGELWTLVDTAGQRGYLMSKFINVLTQEDSDAYNYAQPTPAPVYTLEDIFPPAAQTMETLAPEMPMNTMINRYGRTDMNVNFRSEASTNSKSKGNLKKNTLVWLIYTSENDFGELWTYVMVNGETGYIKTEYLSLLAAEDSAALDSAQSTPAPVYTVDDIFQTVETY